MAKLLYANEGTVELMPDTMAVLRGLPAHWWVILNARPAGAHHTREIDALVITRRALHLIEFKYRQGVAQILNEANWSFGGYPERGSPAVQARQTADAFKTWLRADNELRHLEGAVLPWVVLERQDRKKLPWNDIELTQGVRLLVERMGARPLDTLTVQGRVMSLEEGRALEGVRVRVCSSVTTGPLNGFEREVTTDEQGGFTVHGAPVGAFSAEFCGAKGLDGAPERSGAATHVVRAGHPLPGPPRTRRDAGAEPARRWVPAGEGRHW